MTSGSQATAGKRSRAKLLVVAAIVGATAFGLFVGYLAYVNDSFPTAQRPFADYAQVTSSVFNGTEFAFWVEWQTTAYIPYQAQLTSSVTDAANTPVCGLELSSVASGQVIFMPFSVASTMTSVTNVDLSIAVRSATNATSFTIVYSVPSAAAQPGNITPSSYSCQQPSGVGIE